MFLIVSHLYRSLKYADKVEAYPSVSLTEILRVPAVFPHRCKTWLEMTDLDQRTSSLHDSITIALIVIDAHPLTYGL